MITISIIGSGNVASHLLLVFTATDGVFVIQNYSRNTSALPTNTPITNDFSKLKKADIYIICVSDNAIEEVSNQLTNHNGLVVHTSGSVPLKALSANKNSGVFYPLQTFTKRVSVDFSTIPICIEVKKKSDLKLLKKLGELVSGVVNEISSEKRKQLHIAAVFVNNFSNHLYHIGNSICEDNSVSFELLKPLINETVKKIENTTPFKAQTGPAKRHDSDTIESHIQLLKNEKHKEIYSIISQSISDTYGKKL